MLARVEADKATLWSSPAALAEFPGAFLKGLRETLDEEPENSLVWATDPSAVMRRRQAERAERAAKGAGALRARVQHRRFVAHPSRRGRGARCGRQPGYVLACSLTHAAVRCCCVRFVLFLID